MKPSEPASTKCHKCEGKGTFSIRGHHGMHEMQCDKCDGKGLNSQSLPDAPDAAWRNAFAASRQSEVKRYCYCAAPNFTCAKCGAPQVAAPRSDYKLDPTAEPNAPRMGLTEKGLVDLYDELQSEPWNDRKLAVLTLIAEVRYLRKRGTDYAPDAELLSRAYRALQRYESDDAEASSVCADIATRLRGPGQKRGDGQ